MKASLRGYVGWAQQVGSAQQLLLALSRCVWGPGAGRQRSGSFLFVHLLVIVKGLPAPPGPVGDNPAAAPPPRPPAVQNIRAAAFPGVFAQAPQTSCPNRVLVEVAAHHPQV